MDKKIGLTEKEKWECTMLWLMTLHMAFVNEKRAEPACVVCPHIMKCPSFIKENDRKCISKVVIPLTENFKVLEQSVGKDMITRALLCVNLAQLEDSFFHDIP